MTATRPGHLRGSPRAHRRRPPARGRQKPAVGAASATRTTRRPHVEAARASGRRRLAVLAGLATLAGLAGASLGIAHSPLFSAREIRIVGTSHGEDAAILAASGLGAHPPLIDINPAADVRAIERLAWIDTARVAVSFPSSVAVDVTERVPVAFVPLVEGGALVDASGRVLADVGREPAGVVTVEGGAVPRPGQWFGGRDRWLFAVAAEVPMALVGRITGITRTRRDGIVVDMADEPLVILGSPTDAREKFVALATVLADISLTGIRAIDLRAPSNPVLTP